VQLDQNKEVALLLIKPMFEHPSVSSLFHLVCGMSYVCDTHVLILALKRVVFDICGSLA
jgi:hypothetical protein